MNDDVLVKVECASKKYCRSLKRSLWYGVQDVVGELIGRTEHHDTLRKNEFWALENISFELARGDCLGLIGPNGAGKSTLLKMLNGLVKPDKGRITMRGKVGALIELGAGFNPILTARENIYINASVLGFSKKEIDKKFDNIVEFAEISEFLDTPVQNYSSGMKVRLGFAVAAQLEPDVLLIDEVLAVGDAAFKTKCIGTMAKMLPRTAMVFVSHSMPLIGRMCNKAVLVAGGKRSFESFDVPFNILEYTKLNQYQNSYTLGEEKVDISATRVMVGDAEIESETVEVTKFAPVKLILDLQIKQRLNDFMLNVAFFDQEEKNVAETFSVDQNFFVRGTTGFTRLELEFKKFCLNAGKYSVAVGIIERKPDGSRGDIYYTKRGLINIFVTGKIIGYSPVQLDCDWRELQL